MGKSPITDINQYYSVSLMEKFAAGVYLITICISMIITTYLLLKGKRNEVLKSYVALQVVIVMWLFFRIFEELTTNVQELYITMRLTFIPLCFVGVACFVFCAFFANYKLNKFIIFYLYVPSIFFSIMNIINYKLLFIKSVDITTVNTYGTVFWIYIVYTYVLISIGIILVILHAIKQYKRYKMQSVFIVLAIIIPAAISVLAGAIIKDKVDFDLTPTCFSLSLSFFAIAVFKYRFLNILPIALHDIVENIKECIIIIGNDDNIVYYNNSFESVFAKHIDIKKNSKVTKFADWLKNITESSKDSSILVNAISNGVVVHVEGEITLIKTERKYFLVYARPIVISKNKMNGRIVSFNDITKYKGLLWEVNMKNNELEAMNDELIELNVKLKDYADKAEELAVARERNRFARDAHDTLGHTMVTLITLLEIIGIHIDKDIDEAKKELKKAIKMSKDGMYELRRSIYALTKENFNSKDIVNSLKDLIDSFKHIGICIEFNVDGNIPKLDKDCADVVYRVIQESITNSIKHGRAKNITVFLKSIESRIQIFIFDDGLGCKNIVKGLGLTGMEQRVNSVKGNIIYGSDGERGFNINVDIPIVICQVLL